MEYEDNTFNHAYFCIYDNNALVKPGYMKALKEGESEHRVVALYFC